MTWGALQCQPIDFIPAMQFVTWAPAARQVVPDSVGNAASSQPLMPADITRTSRYPRLFARRAAVGAFRHQGFEQ
jgi:hypothetical protein